MRLCGRWLAAFLLLIFIGGMVSACRPTAEKVSPQSSAIAKRFGAEPVILELRLDRQRLTVAERLAIELRAETDEEHAVKFVELKEFAGFAVSSAAELKPELTAPGRVVFGFRYVLEPLAAGKAQVPVLTVETWKKAEAKASIATVATESVTVEVLSLLAKDDAGATISDIAPPLAKPLNPWLLAGLGLAGILALALIVYLVRRRLRRVIPAPPPLPPHLLAYQALDRLLATDLLASSQVKTFYEALSAILRHYIEQRFGLRAPEQTTEEFLAELGRGGAGPRGRSFGIVSDKSHSSIMVAASHKLLLREFLSHCDLVKFARHTPSQSEAEESVERCRRFVRETEPLANVDSTAGGKA
jgi:hypothetical protein